MIVATGAIADRPLPRTFATIAARRFTGELTIDAGGRRYRIDWRDGAVVGAASPHPADSAAKIAITLGVLSSTQAGEVARVIADNPGCDEVEVVAKVARLTSDMVGRLARRLVATRAARIFTVDAGEFQLDDSPPLAAVQPVDARWVMYSGVRMHYSIDRLHQEVAAMASAIQLVAGADLTAFGFGEAEADALARLHAGRLNLAPTPIGLDVRVVESIALVLLACGLAEPVPGEVPVQLPPRAAPRPTARGSTQPPPARGATQAPPVRGATQAPPVRGATQAPPVHGATQAPPVRIGTPARGAPRTTPSVTDLLAAGAQASAQAAAARSTPASVPAARPGRPSTVDGILRRSARVRTLDPGKIAALVAERKAVLEAGGDHFALLGVARDASVEQVRTAYFGLARHLHPDRLAAAGVLDEGREAHRVFSRVNEAFAVLSDPARRFDYERVLQAGGAHAAAAAAETAEVAVRQVLGGEEAYRLGEAALRRMQLEDALAHFQRAVELAPNEADHHAMLGWATYLVAPDKSAAMSIVRGLLRKATELSDKTALPHLLLGRIARIERNGAEAVTHLRRALELAPSNSEAMAELRAAESLRQHDTQSRGLFGRKK
ncbi:MAG: DnaJ domain-containing protein [Kofleriaceae bacterium]